MGEMVVTERTPLLSPATAHAPPPSSSHLLSSAHTRSSSVVPGAVSRRSVAYESASGDEDSEAMAGSLRQTNNGLRAWYSSYSTIDWIHDRLKERERMRVIRSEGHLRALFDSSHSWILVLLVGVAVGMAACAVDVAQNRLASLRVGYCDPVLLVNSSERAGFKFVSKDACCRMAPVGRDGVPSVRNSSNCDNWVPWDKALDEHFSWQLFIFSGGIMSLVASLVTNLSVSLVSLPDGTKRKSYQAAGSGISEVKTILGGFVIRGYLGFHTMATKLVGLIFAVASGLSIGQQGPLVHIACCVGNIFSRFFPKYAHNEAKKRELLSAAAAAGVSVAFASPIGGVLFSLEEVSYYFPMKTMWRSFFCSAIAAVTLKILNPLGSGKLVKFQVYLERDWRDFELIPFALLGVLGGLFGALFIRLTSLWSRVKSSPRYPLNPVLEVVLVALLSAAINFNDPLTRISLNDLVEALFSDCKVGDPDEFGLCADDAEQVLWKLLRVIGVKAGLILITWGIRVPGGAFVSSMAIGAGMGRAVAEVVMVVQRTFPTISFLSHCIGVRDCVSPGVYAMVGAAAAVSGVTRMTVSLVVIMVELTGALKLVLPIMVAIMVAKWVADSITRDSLYDATIRRNGFPYLDHKREHHGGGGGRGVYTTGDVAELDPLACFQVGVAYGAPEVGERLERMRHREDCGFAVLDGRCLAGYMAYRDLQHVAESLGNDSKPFFFRKMDADGVDGVLGTDLTLWMDQAPIVLGANASMDLCLEMFVKLGVKTICVVNFTGTGGGASRGGGYVGLIHKKRLLAWLKE
ncbi:chloride channel [Chytriomyces sp. MP71]|nr:chloride channel [Chytriomyces sp. MP71]